MDLDDINATPPAWLAAFEAEIQAAVRRPFRWGQHDCCTFAARCWAAQTGDDALLDLAWSSEEEAASILAEAGGLLAAVTDRLGPPVPPLLASLGDVVLAVDPLDPLARELMAVCVGPHHVLPSARGLAVLQLGDARYAWKAVRHG